jgi:hypothetical protein
MHEPSLTAESNRQHFFDRLTRKSALVIALCSSPFFFIFAYFGDLGKGRTAAICAFAIITAVWYYWDLRRHVWFWFTVAIVIALHVPLVLFVPWTDTKYPGVVLLPFALLDYGIVYGCIKLAEMMMTKRVQPPDKAQPSGE